MPAKNKGGRPKHKIDYKTLQGLCSILCTGEECAAILGIDYDTLNRNLKDDGYGGFSEYLKKYGAEGKSCLRRNQFKMSEKNPVMAIWLGKQHLGQKDKFEQDLNIKGPVKINIKHTQEPTD